jgi:hypothetical protein
MQISIHINYYMHEKYYSSESELTLTCSTIRY